MVTVIFGYRRAMAGPKGSKYYDVFLDYEVWLTNRQTGNRVDDQFVKLLSAIDTKGSIRLAAEETGLSYRKAWGDIQEAEKFLGFTLVAKVRGGRNGGKSHLTADGADLVAGFKQLHEEFNLAIHKTTKEFFHKLNKAED